MAKESKKYEENFNTLKSIAEELRRQETSIDDVISKGKKAAEAAKNCIKILKEEKGNFKKLEEEVEDILDDEEEDNEEEE